MRFFSKKATKSYISAQFRQDDFLIFGPETRGLPESLLDANEAESFLIPMMNPAVRSLNLANAVSIVLYEGLRQLGRLGVASRRRIVDTNDPSETSGI